MHFMITMTMLLTTTSMMTMSMIMLTTMTLMMTIIKRTVSFLKKYFTICFSNQCTSSYVAKTRK